MSRVEKALNRAGGRAVAPEAPPRGADAYPVESEPRTAPTPIASRPIRDIHAYPAAPHARRPRMQLLSSALTGKLVTCSEAPPGCVEEYRRLAAELHLAQVRSGLQSLMISSALPGDGKSLTATNLALTLSESYDRKVLLIDADLRRPTLHEIFRLPNGRGLVDALRSQAHGSLRAIEIGPGLAVLPAGSPEDAPLAEITSERMRAIVREAASTYDWVILDTPPVGILPDANLLAQFVDGVVLVIAAAATPYTAVKRAIADLGEGRIVGVVLNRAVAGARSIEYYHHYYYGRTASSPAENGR